MNPLLEVKNLTVQFEKREGTRFSEKKERKKFAAVDSVNFCLYPDEILGIVGESGSGKSTVARAVAGLIPISSGSIVLDGEEITDKKGRDLRMIYKKIQMVFQSPADSFDPRKTLGYSIGESLKNNGMTRKEVRTEVKKLLQSCELPEEFAAKYPRQVSGGQCQRVAIARALAIRPKIIVFDEATSALDMTVQKKIMELLSGVKKTYGLSYLFICHDLALVHKFCSRILVMHDGKIVEEGEPDAVIGNPRKEYTRQLIDAVL